MNKILDRAVRRNAFRARRRKARWNAIPHVWMTSSIVRDAYPLYVRLNRSQNLPRARSYAHAAEIARDRGFREAK